MLEREDDPAADDDVEVNVVSVVLPSFSMGFEELESESIPLQ